MKRLLRLPAVLDRTGLSRSTLYATPDFPKSVKVGDRAVAWSEDEVDAWIAAKLDAREAA
jgi:prophage regulatory protein